ncbi:hypothetical protein NHQ30_009691 [Ciborinia camelliae]|nr:hypothetical protein NHQ30_009691 [Ciborinia camelliae]
MTNSLRSYKWAIITNVLAVWLSIGILILASRSIPIISLDTRALKITAGSPVSAYDQYDIYFTMVCKSNDHIAGLDKQVAEDICEGYGLWYSKCSLVEMIFGDFGNNTSKSVSEHLDWLSKAPNHLINIPY